MHLLLRILHISRKYILFGTQKFCTVKKEIEFLIRIKVKTGKVNNDIIQKIFFGKLDNLKRRKLIRSLIC